MTERLVIDRLAHRGDGVADTPSGPLYVPYTLPGETILKGTSRRTDQWITAQTT